MIVLDSFKTQADTLTTQDELCDLFSASIKQLGYSGFDAYSVKPGTVDNKDVPVTMFLCDYNGKLPLDYILSGFLQDDPVIAEIARTSTPFEYLEFLRGVKSNKSAKWQLRVILFNGVRRAWIIPLSVVDAVRGVTIYMKTKGNEAEQHFAQTRNEIQLMSMTFMEHIVRLSELPVVDNDPMHDAKAIVAEISKREKECLSWAAKGKTNWEIGQILDISENTVRYHLKKAFKRLGANSRARAVNRALRIGLIEI